MACGQGCLGVPDAECLLQLLSPLLDLEEIFTGVSTANIIMWSNVNNEFGRAAACVLNINALTFRGEVIHWPQGVPWYTLILTITFSFKTIMTLVINGTFSVS